MFLLCVMQFVYFGPTHKNPLFISETFRGKIIHEDEKDYFVDFHADKRAHLYLAPHYKQWLGKEQCTKD